MSIRADGAAPSYAGGFPPATAPPAPTLPAETSGPPPVARSAAAGRRTSRRGLLLSVLVVVVGGLFGLAGGQMLTRHTRVLAVVRDVPAGARITDADLTVASVTSDPNLHPVEASQRAEVVGKNALVPLLRGGLLTRAQVGAGSGFTRGQMLVGLPCKPGQLPARGLTAGQQVLIVATPGGTSAGPAGGASGPTAAAADERVAATVVEVGPMNPATQVSVVDVRVDPAAGVAVARLGSTGNLALILLPAGG